MGPLGCVPAGWRGCRVSGSGRHARPLCSCAQPGGAGSAVERSPLSLGSSLLCRSTIAEEQSCSLFTMQRSDSPLGVRGSRDRPGTFCVGHCCPDTFLKLSQLYENRVHKTLVRCVLFLICFYM